MESPPGPVLLSASGVTRVFGEGDGAFHALRGVSTDIVERDTVAIIGKSGSGKSTLMHILAGLDRPTSGSVRFAGTELTELSSRELADVRNRSFAFVFQQFHLLPRVTVADNVGLQLRIRGVPANARRQRVAAALDAVGISDKAKNRATELSGGQRQRVALARAIVAEPKVLFADEPTGNLDSATGESVIQLLLDLNETMGVSVVVVTHDPDFAQRCRRQIHVRDGEIIEDAGRPVTAGVRR